MESSCHQSLRVILTGEGESYSTQHTGGTLLRVTIVIDGQMAALLASWYLGVARELHKKPLLDSAVFVRNRNKYLRIKSDVLVTAETLAFQESYNLRYRLNLGR